MNEAAVDRAPGLGPLPRRAPRGTEAARTPQDAAGTSLGYELAVFALLGVFVAAQWARLVTDRAAGPVAAGAGRGLCRRLRPAPRRDPSRPSLARPARLVDDRPRHSGGGADARRARGAAAAADELGRARLRDQHGDPGDRGGPPAVSGRRHVDQADPGPRRSGRDRRVRRRRVLARPPPRAPAAHRARHPGDHLRGRHQPRPPRGRSDPRRVAAGARDELALDHPAWRLAARAGARALGRRRRRRPADRGPARLRARCSTTSPGTSSAARPTSASSGITPTARSTGRARGRRCSPSTARPRSTGRRACSTASTASPGSARRRRIRSPWSSARPATRRRRASCAGAIPNG